MIYTKHFFYVLPYDFTLNNKYVQTYIKINVVN